MVTRPAKVNPLPPAEVKKVKIVLVGDSCSGKTAFAKVAAEQAYPESYEGTVGSDFFMRSMQTHEGQFQFNIWDLSGETVYSEVRNEFYKDSQILILAYDITKRKTFDNLEQIWLKEARAHGGEALPIYVVGTKMDLDDRRAIPKAEAERWVSTKQFQGYYETSAKEDNGFLRIFREMAANS